MYSIGKYKIYNNKSIGKGSFSKIYRGVDDNQNDIAIKIIKKKKISDKIILREISLLKKVAHTNIVRLLDVYVSENKYYLILEYCELGDLKQFVKNKILTEKCIQCFMLQIKNGLEYLYNNKIIHRDLKPQNILVTRDEILKISDFGFAKFHTESMSQTICGSPLYMAPEILTYKKYTDTADLWSVGVIMYELFFKKTPVTGNNIYNLVQNIDKYEFRMEDSNISLLGKELLSCLLKKNPHKRITWTDFFKHTWFISNVPKCSLKICKTSKISKSYYDDDLIFKMDSDDDIDIDNNSTNTNDKNYNILCSYKSIDMDDNYLDVQSSLVQSLEDDNYVVVSSKHEKYPEFVPSSAPNNFGDIINSLRSSLSYIFRARSI